MALEKLCTAGAWPPLPRLAKPLPKAKAKEAPLLPSTLRRELLVDDDEGAGLELETVTEGLRICEILPSLAVKPQLKIS